jgi:hypothetical protein
MDTKPKLSSGHNGGGVKATTLAGLLLNHHDDKKGYHNVYCHFMEKMLKKSCPPFPDVSNTRYGSHGEVACELIARVPLYIAFLEYVRDSKDKQEFTNIESNLYDALKDIPTLTELAVMSLFYLSISCPYVEHARRGGPAEINMLDEGAWHEEVFTFMQSIIANPDLVLGKDAQPNTAHLDKRSQWIRPDTIQAIQDLSPSLPNLRDAFISFNKRALNSLMWFSTELAKGSEIDMMSPEEKELSFMPTTNDINEGLLGEMRRTLTRNPTKTLDTLNAEMMIRHNDVDKFISTRLSPVQQKMLRAAGRWISASGAEKA